MKNTNTITFEGSGHGFANIANIHTAPDSYACIVVEMVSLPKPYSIGTVVQRSYSFLLLNVIISILFGIFSN